jgi:hypothetical protein
MPFRKQLLPQQILPAPQHEPWEYSTPAHRDGDYSPKHDIPGECVFRPSWPISRGQVQDKTVARPQQGHKLGAEETKLILPSPLGSV